MNVPLIIVGSPNDAWVVPFCFDCGPNVPWGRANFEMKIKQMQRLTKFGVPLMLRGSVPGKVLWGPTSIKGIRVRTKRLLHSARMH